MADGQETTFTPGQVVRLRSGGPIMTVESDRYGDVLCVWFEKNKAHRESFPPALLAPYQPPRPSVARVSFI